MDITTLPLVGALQHAAADLVTALTAVLSPAGPLAPALAVVVLTVAVRLVLVPVSVLRVRAERDRRRIAPLVVALRARCGRDRERFARELRALMTAEGVSPVAGCMPLLLQAPVVSLLYALVTHGSIAGTTNTLLQATLAGIHLGQSAVAVVTSPLWGHAWVVVVLLVLLAGVVEVTRRMDDRWNAPVAIDETAPGSAVVRRVVPHVAVVFAALAPLAAALYVVTSAGWALGERVVLRRLLG